MKKRKIANRTAFQKISTATLKYSLFTKAAFVILSLIVVFTAVLSCKSKPIHVNPNIDIQGHRGCRGLRPENTIVAFKKAIDIGVNTLELDVVVNKFDDVIISHEPFFNHEISTDPNGELISEENEKSHNIFEMTLEEIQSYDVGIKDHPKYPHQKKIKVVKPTLEQMVTNIENYVKSENYPLPEYNIEIKRVKEQDGIFHPEMKKFADVVCDEIIKLGIAKRTTVQCFDIETLQYVQIKYPDMRLVLLIMNQQSYEENIATLGFKPWAYSPFFKLVSKALIDYGKKENIKIIPWTVNEEADIIEMMNLGVDGIISDYPDRVVELNQISE